VVNVFIEQRLVAVGDLGNVILSVAAATCTEVPAVIFTSDD